MVFTIMPFLCSYKNEKLCVNQEPDVGETRHKHLNQVIN